jgi:hypothetical protein
MKERLKDRFIEQFQSIISINYLKYARFQMKAKIQKGFFFPYYQPINTTPYSTIAFLYRKVTWQG